MLPECSLNYTSELPPEGSLWLTNENHVQYLMGWSGLWGPCFPTVVQRYFSAVPAMVSFPTSTATAQRRSTRGFAAPNKRPQAFVLFWEVADVPWRSDKNFGGVIILTRVPSDILILCCLLSSPLENYFHKCWTRARGWQPLT